jgi:hypothetical protein
MVYSNAVTLLEDCLTHTQQPKHILCCLDNPYARTLGFQCEECYETFETGMKAIKEISDIPLRQSFLTPESRQKMARDLNKGILPKG